MRDLFTEFEEFFGLSLVDSDQIDWNDLGKRFRIK